jgi:hypothetical protein
MSTVVCRRVRLTGTVEVALPAEQAFIMFTPSGERTWAQGWDPSFPSPGTDETDPGTVFRTVHRGRESIWTVVRCEVGHSIEYAVATPQERCGLVTVTCEASPNGTKARSVTTSRHSAARRTLSSTGSRRTTRRSSLTGNAQSPRPFGLEVERPHAMSQRHQQSSSGAPGRLSSCEPESA